MYFTFESLYAFVIFCLFLNISIFILVNSRFFFSLLPRQHFVIIFLSFFNLPFAFSSIIYILFYFRFIAIKILIV